MYENITTGIRCQHTYLENGVHEFVLKEASRAAVDEFLDLLDAVFRVTLPEETIPYLMDFRESGIPPLGYTTSRTKAFLKQYPHGPRGRSAYLHGPGSVDSTVRSLVNLVNPGMSERFAADQRDEAVNWLLDNR
jgi:hypothetical protein